MQAFDLKVFVVCACLAATQEADWWGSWWDDPRSRCGRWWSDQLRGIREDDDGQVSHHITSAEAKASSPQLHSFNAPVLDFVVWALLSFRGRLYHGSPFEHPTEFKDAKDIRVRRSICSMHSLFHATSVSLDDSKQYALHRWLFCKLVKVWLVCIFEHTVRQLLFTSFYPQRQSSYAFLKRKVWLKRSPAEAKHPQSVTLCNGWPTDWRADCRVQGGLLSVW